MSTASQSWWFDLLTCDSQSLTSSFCLSSLLHHSTTNIVSIGVFTSSKNFSTFSQNDLLSFDKSLFGLVIIYFN
jgi:hypothetical protein